MRARNIGHIFVILIEHQIEYQLTLKNILFLGICIRIKKNEKMKKKMIIDIIYIYKIICHIMMIMYQIWINMINI